MTSVFVQPDPKQSKNAERYSVCNTEAAFKGHAALRGQHFAGTTRSFIYGGVTSEIGGFADDRRYVAFIEPSAPALAAGIAAGPAGGASGSTTGGWRSSWGRVG